MSETILGTSRMVQNEALLPSTTTSTPVSPLPPHAVLQRPRHLLYASLSILYVFLYHVPTAHSFSSSSCCRQHPSTTPFHQRTMYRDNSALLVATIDISSSNEMSDFQRRMRRLVQQDDKKRARSSSRPTGSPPNFHVVRTLEEYKHVVGDEKEKIVAVRFFAPWCKACKAIAPSFYRLASTYSNVVFVDVPVTQENTNLHQGLGVPSLPFGHIYHPYGGLVEERRISRRYFASFAKSLKSYIDGECSINSVSFESDEENSIDADQFL